MTWTNAWDETKPADTDLANTLGTQGRQVKLDVRERLNSQHIFGQSTTNDGEHRNITITSNGMAANTAAIALSSFSLTAANAQSMLDLAGTWNTSGVPTAIKLNILNTASGTGALLLDLQVGGSSVFNVDVNGVVDILGYKGKLNTTFTLAANALTVNLNLGNIVPFTLNQNINATTINNIPGSRFSQIIWIVTANGTPFTWAWLTGTVVWDGSSAPTIVSTNNHVMVFVTYTTNGGSKWRGIIVGSDYPS